MNHLYLALIDSLPYEYDVPVHYSYYSILHHEHTE